MTPAISPAPPPAPAGPLAAAQQGALRALAARWADAKPAERANAQTYVRELCEALDVPRPGPAGSGYEFELPVKLVSRDGSEAQGYVDCYKEGHFVLEAKDYAAGKGGDLALRRAWGQARIYAANDPTGTAPPYLLVLDVGKTLMVWHRWGGQYQGYAAGHRIDLPTLHARPADVALLRDVWTDPARRDPRRRAQAVTQEIAGKLARLAAALEARGFERERVARFLMRVVFSCFAEDVGLLPQDAFRQTVQNAGVDGSPAMFAGAVEALWRAMDQGGAFGWLRLLRFNGHFFRDAEALPLERADIALLLEAAKADWRDVEPAIFGTLLTRALDPAERHRLGAEYTPRAYIERLVRPTVEAPVRERWTAVQAAALQLRETGKPKDRAAAEQQLRGFLGWLRSLRVLDPACGSGNFLYVTMHVLKAVEHEAMQELVDLTGATEIRYEEISPANFLGIELDHWAREIAELTLWIGFHQHWARHHGVQPPEPVLQDTGTLDCRDAVLAWDAVRDDPARDRPDPTPRVAHAVTGRLVPDPAARLRYREYVNPRPAAWPEADFIVGNPPYIGGKRVRAALGDGYADALQRSYPGLPDAADLVMYWWDHAARLVAEGRVVRAGLITTSSLRQTHNRPVVDAALARGARLVWAVADHPWADEADGAAVRVAMTVLARDGAGDRLGVTLGVVDGDGRLTEEAVPRIHADLSAHADVGTAAAQPLAANAGMCYFGFLVNGAGFLLEPEEYGRLLAADPRHAEVLKPILGGRDVAQRPAECYVIDFGERTLEEARAFPLLYNVVLDRVKPQRDANRDRGIRENWWRFHRIRQELRRATAGLRRYVVTTETMKHRAFTFLDAAVAPDHSLVCIATDDAFHLGVLSSAPHVWWAVAAGGKLGVGNDPRYNRTATFDPFPFPDPPAEVRGEIGALAEALDAHRKAALARDPKITVTGMYNVVEKLRAGAPLTDKERVAHEAGACGVLRELHDRLDAAVAAAYGWPWPLPRDAVLARLVALHDERITEEARGAVRWLRPEHQRPRPQAPDGAPGPGNASTNPATPEMAAALPSAFVPTPGGAPAAPPPAARPEDVPAAEARQAGARERAAAREPWPADAVGQITLLRAFAAAAPLSVGDAVGRIAGAKRDLVARHLETLAILGEVRDLGGGRYAVAAGTSSEP